MAMQFEWDEEKAEVNLQKHKIGFEEAKAVFGDPLSITVDDPDHSTDEQRYIDIGKSSSGKLLVVASATMATRGKSRKIQVVQKARFIKKG